VNAVYVPSPTKFSSMLSNRLIDGLFDGIVVETGNGYGACPLCGGGDGNQGGDQHQ